MAILFDWDKKAHQTLQNIKIHNDKNNISNDIQMNSNFGLIKKIISIALHIGHVISLGQNLHYNRQSNTLRKNKKSTSLTAFDIFKFYTLTK